MSGLAAVGIWPAHGTRHRTGSSLVVAARLAAAQLISAPARSVLETLALASADGLLAVDFPSTGRDVLAVTAGLALLPAVVAASVVTPHVERRRTAAVLYVTGARARDLRRPVLVAVIVQAVVAVVGGVAVARLLGVATGTTVRLAEPAVFGVAVPVVAALVSLPGRVRQPRLRPLVPAVVRISAGFVLVAMGTLLPSVSRTWTDLSLTLVPGLVLITVGVVVAVPAVVRTVAAMLARRRSGRGRVVAQLASQRLAAITPAACVIGVGVCLVGVQSILGTGLAEREAQRRASLPDLRFGLSDRQIVVGGRSDLAFGLVRGSVDRKRIARAAQQLRGRAAVAAVAAPVAWSSAGAAGSPPVGPAPFAPRRRDGLQGTSASVAIATPELLAVLGLEDQQVALDRGDAVVLDPSVVGSAGEARLTLELPGRGTVVLPAVVAQRRRIATALPGVLLVPSALRGGSGPQRTIVTGVVARFERPATAADAALFGRLVGAPAQLGDASDPRVAERSRLDAASTVVISAPGDVVLGTALAAVVGLVALVLGLQFAASAHRFQDDLLEVVGAPTSFRRRLLAWQGGIVTGLGVLIGGGIAVSGTAVGITSYNEQGRGSLPPIPFGVPAAFLLGAVLLVPLGAAAGAVLVPRRPVDIRRLDDRLLA